MKRTNLPSTPGASKIYNLKTDELEAVQEIVLHEGWEALLKVIETHVMDIEAQIHKINPSEKDCGIMLTVERSKAVGARNLLARIAALKAQKQ